MFSPLVSGNVEINNAVKSTLRAKLKIFRCRPAYPAAIPPLFYTELYRLLICANLPAAAGPISSSSAIFVPSRSITSGAI